MKRREIEYRQKVATLADKILENQINFFDFLEKIGGEYETGDEQVDDLIDMLEHQPKKGGFLGVTDAQYEAYLVGIKELIEQLKKS